MKVSTSCFFRYYRRISNFYRLYKMLYLAYTKIMPVIFRESLKKLIVKINKEKDELKRNGIMQGRIQDFKRGGGWQTIFIEGW